MISSRLSVAVLAALAIGVALNVVQFPSIEGEVANNWRAWHTYETSDLDRYPHAERRYGFFLQLGEVAPQARLIVPPSRAPAPTGRPSFQPRIYGLAKVQEIETRNYDPVELGESFDVDDRFVVVEGPYGSKSYRIALLEGATELVFLMNEDEDLIVVDSRLMGADLPTEVLE